MIQSIEIHKVNKWFGKGKERTQVIRDVSIDIPKGEVYGFLGPNGAGKSTIIKMLLGFLRADSGFMRVNGKVVGKEEYRYQIGYLSELPFFYTHLTARETLMVSGRLSGMDKGKILKETTTLLGRVNLAHTTDQRVGSFSKGMQQRLGLANALIHDPPILIFDEPMSGLDPLGRHLVKELINEMKDSGKTIFFSSHILSDIEDLCDSIAIIHKGVLFYSGNTSGFIRDGQSLEKQFIKIIRENEHEISS